MHTYIIGPCCLENIDLFINVGRKLSQIFNNKNWYYKTSFDKANRTSIEGKRGLGLQQSIEAFQQIKQEIPSIKLTTDVHECWQVEKFVNIIDVIQIPAFLCRQTDLIVECARHFNIVNIKKGQWIGPNNLIKSVDKIKHTNPNAQAWITNRGSNFGYDILLLDNTIVDRLKSVYDKVILDCTHSVQRSRHVYKTQGDRELAKRYLLSTGIFNYDGVFIESHPNPKTAWSDGDCQILLSEIPKLIDKKEKIDEILYS